MTTRRFEVGVSASPAERTVKDSPVAFPLWPHVPTEQGLFDPRHEKDSCGVGFIADIKGRKSHKIVEDAIQILCNLETAARSAPIRAPATAPASWCRSRMHSS